MAVGFIVGVLGPRSAVNDAEFMGQVRSDPSLTARLNQMRGTQTDHRNTRFDGGTVAERGETSPGTGPGPRRPSMGGRNTGAGAAAPSTPAPPPLAASPAEQRLVQLLDRLDIRQVDDTVQMPEALVNKYRDNFQETLRLLQTAAGKFSTDSEGNQAFQVTYIDEGSLIERTNLQPGDVIKSVNGIPVRDYNQARQLYNTLRNETAFVIVVERGGVLQTIVYTVQ